MQVLSPKLRSWASDIEPNTLSQAYTTAKLPIVEAVALMPDAHLGSGSTVGSVIATKGAVIPAAVGVDIGCGMAAISTYLNAADLPDSLEGFMEHTIEAIPAGVGKGHTLQTPDMMRQWAKLDATAPDMERELKDTAVRQLGSLGSGNHFFEICLDTNDRVWLVLHSGSRGVGNKLAKVHIEEAQRLEREEYHHGLEDPDLAWLIANTPEFDAYIKAMLWAQDYAYINREVMLTRIMKAFEKFIGIPELQQGRINCHHNFTQLEIWDNKPLWITRKGAIKADTTDMGIIPGSMGTNTYIIQGKGNAASYNSCSHGAGRRMSRGVARRTFSGEDLAEKMKGKVWLSGAADSLTDEHPDSYKDIDQVMDDQKDLVTVHAVLRQIFNYKGTNDIRRGKRKRQ